MKARNTSQKCMTCCLFFLVGDHVILSGQPLTADLILRTYFTLSCFLVIWAAFCIWLYRYEPPVHTFRGHVVVEGVFKRFGGSIYKLPAGVSILRFNCWRRRGRRIVLITHEKSGSYLLHCFTYTSNCMKLLLHETSQSTSSMLSACANCFTTASGALRVGSRDIYSRVMTAIVSSQTFCAAFVVRLLWT